MMQKILIIKIGRGKILSKPWCFEALCLIDDNRTAKGLVSMCMPAISYLFEGTKATDEFLQRLGYTRLNELCEQVREWYLSDIEKLIDIQKENTPQQDNSSGGIRGVYYALFKAWGILGSEIARQKPEHIFLLLTTEESKEDMIQNMSDDVKAMYGL